MNDCLFATNTHDNYNVIHLSCIIEMIVAIKKENNGEVHETKIKKENQSKSCRALYMNASI